jgi:hypothetical protein
MQPRIITYASLGLRKQITEILHAFKAERSGLSRICSVAAALTLTRSDGVGPLAESCETSTTNTKPNLGTYELRVYSTL